MGTMQLPREVVLLLKLAAGVKNKNNRSQNTYFPLPVMYKLLFLLTEDLSHPVNKNYFTCLLTTLASSNMEI